MTEQELEPSLPSLGSASQDWHCTILAFRTLDTSRHNSMDRRGGRRERGSEGKIPVLIFLASLLSLELSSYPAGPIFQRPMKTEYIFSKATYS